MNRIDETLAALKANNKKMLSPYITAGDPSPDYTVKLMHALVESGANIIELGMPFSDPMAEGPVIQAAMERALRHGVHCEQVLDMVKTFRQKNQTTPVVLMGYVNPIEYFGYERFAKMAVAAGVDGTIFVDLPPEESNDVQKIWAAHNLYGIYLCSPTTTDERMKLINASASGYLYYVSLKGVTGSDDIDLGQVQKLYERRKLQTNLPLMVGFGIKTADMAARVASFSDGVIVGAALINTVITAFTANKDCIAAGALLIKSMRAAMDNGK